MNTDARSDEELNYIIAGWLGWTFHPESSPGDIELYEPEHWTDETGMAANWFFCDDLNAVHQAWLKLNKDEKHRFQDALQRVLLSSLQASCWMIGAEARQRAEALVKVIEEGKK